jgi:dTDP-4-amino-4,6-dideoxygalactose transaminase
MKIIPYGYHHIDKDDIKEVGKALKSKLITSGPYVQKLEKKFKNFFRVRYAISCSSATSGLFLALKSLNLKKNQSIICPAINFVSLNNVSLLLKIKTYLADVDINTGQLSKKTILDCINKNKIKNLAVIIPMPLGGSVKYTKDLLELKKKYNFLIIEDACHALGSNYRIQKKNFLLGSCKHSDVSIFSFHPVKSITSGEGGMITTNNKILYKRIMLLRNHGMYKKKNLQGYNIVLNSLNFRLSDINCALAFSQFKKLKFFIRARRSIAKYYTKAFNNYGNYFKILNSQDIENSSCHLFQIQLTKKYKSKRNRLKEYLKNNRIISQIHYIPIYKHKIFKRLSYKDLYSSQEFYESTLSLPIYVSLNKKKIDYIIKNIKNFFKD